MEVRHRYPQAGAAGNGGVPRRLLARSWPGDAASRSVHRTGFLFGQPSRVGAKRLPLGRRAGMLSSWWVTGAGAGGGADRVRGRLPAVEPGAALDGVGAAAVAADLDDRHGPLAARDRAVAAAEPDGGPSSPVLFPGHLRCGGPPAVRPGPGRRGRADVFPRRSALPCGVAAGGQLAQAQPAVPERPAVQAVPGLQVQRGGRDGEHGAAQSVLLAIVFIAIIPAVRARRPGVRARLSSW